MEDKELVPLVFLDTSALLPAFARFITEGHSMPRFMTDRRAKRYTFEKCIYEAYMAFRGIGGKKPDEGRERWAQQFLNRDNDPFPFGELKDTIHGGSTFHAAFWINNIDGAVPVRGQEEAIHELHCERSKYHTLCNRFWQMLEQYHVTPLCYASVFDTKDRWGLFSSCPGPESLDEFVRSTVIPSEDLEIVYAAMRLDADIFVTNDLRLTNCSASLGLNYPICHANFCTTSEYCETAERWRQERYRS